MVCQKQKQMKERRRKNKLILLLCFFERVCCYIIVLYSRDKLVHPSVRVAVTNITFNMTDIIITTAISFHPKFSMGCKEKESSSKMLLKKIKSSINRLKSNLGDSRIITSRWRLRSI